MIQIPQRELGPRHTYTPHKAKALQHTLACDPCGYALQPVKQSTIWKSDIKTSQTRCAQPREIIRELVDPYQHMDAHKEQRTYK